MRRDVPDSKYEDSDGEDRNVNDFRDIVEIAREDNVFILEMVTTHHDLTDTHKIYEDVQDNEDKK